VRRGIVVTGLVGVCCLGGCNALFGLTPAIDDVEGDDAAADSAPGDGPAGAWGPVTPIGVAASGIVTEDDPALSPDGTELYFGHQDASGKDIFVARTEPGTDGWLAAIPSELSSMATDGSPRFATENGTLTAYLASSRNGGALDIYRSTRALPASATFDTPAPFAVLNSVAEDATAAPCKQGSSFVVATTRGGASSDLWEIVPGESAEPITAVNTAGNETGPFITEDCRRLYYASNSRGTFDIYVVERAEVGAPWSSPAQVPGLSTTSFNEGDPWLSPDERHVLFASDAAGSLDIVEASR